MRFLLVLSFVINTLTAFSQKLNDPLPFDRSVKKGTLSNGLTYYIKRNLKPEKHAELRLVVKAGSILEDDDQQGLAHFAEHMAFNGTKSFKKNEVVSYLESIGVKFGADLNAYTGFDETVYILPIPTDKKEIVDKSFQILEEWAGAVTFDNKAIDNERGIVLEEARTRKGAGERIGKVLNARRYAGSKYAERNPIGKEEILANFKYNAIKRFYKDWYRPDLMAVIVVGDVEVHEIELLIKEHFSHLKNPKNARPRTYFDTPDITQNQSIVVTDKEVTQSTIDISFGQTPKQPLKSVEDYRNELVEKVMFSMVNGRLGELTQNANPPYFGTYNDIGPVIKKGYEQFASFAILGKAGLQPAITALVQENYRAKKFGFTQTELDRTKTWFMKGMEGSYSEREKTDSRIFVDELVRNFLQDEPVIGVEAEYSYYKQYVEGITLAEVNAMATQKLPTFKDAKLVVYTGKEKPGLVIPTEQELMTMVESVPLNELKPYEDKIVSKILIDKTPTAGKVVSEKTNPRIGTTEFTFENGIKVILKQTAFQNDQVLLSAHRFGGYYKYDPKDRWSAQYAVGAVSSMGLGKFSQQDLGKALEGKSGFATISMDNISESVSGQSKSTLEDIETMLQILYMRFTEPPRMDLEGFKSYVMRAQGWFQDQSIEPEMLLNDSINRWLYGNHPWAPQAIKAENYDKIELERSIEIYKERFSDAGGFTFVLVGNFEIERIKPLLATYIGNLPATNRVRSYKDVGLRAESGPLKRELKRGSEPKSIAQIRWSGETAYSGEEQLRVKALIDVLNIRLLETLREEMQGVYSASMWGGLSKHPYGSYAMTVNIPCGPQNVDKLVARVLDEIEKVKKSGPDETALAKVKETWKQHHKTDITDNGFWLNSLIRSVEMGSDPASILDYEKNVDAITVNDLKGAARKYLDTKKYVLAVLNPEK